VSGAMVAILYLRDVSMYVLFSIYDIHGLLRLYQPLRLECKHFHQNRIGNFVSRKNWEKNVK